MNTNSTLKVVRPSPRSDQSTEPMSEPLPAPTDQVAIIIRFSATQLLRFGLAAGTTMLLAAGVCSALVASGAASWIVNGVDVESLVTFCARVVAWSALAVVFGTAWGALWVLTRGSASHYADGPRAPAERDFLGDPPASVTEHTTRQFLVSEKNDF